MKFIQEMYRIKWIKALLIVLSTIIALYVGYKIADILFHLSGFEKNL